MTVNTYQNIMSFVLAPLSIGAKLYCAVTAVLAAQHSHYASALALVLAYWFLSDFILPTLSIIAKFFLYQSLGKQLQSAATTMPATVSETVVDKPTYLN